MSTDTLEFPEIAAAPASARTDVAVAAAGAIDLKKIDLTAVALAQFGDWRGDVAKVTKDISTMVLDLSIQAKVNEAKSLRQRLINVPQADLRKVATALKSTMAKTSKAVGAELDAGIEAYDAAGAQLTEQIEAAQTRLDEAKEATRQAEEKRLQGLRDQVDALVGKWLLRCSAEGMTAERIKKGIQGLELVPTPPEALDVAAYWREKKSDTLREMDRLMLDAQRAENVQADAERREREQQQAMAMQEIQGIQQQVMIAQVGRLGVRVGGTAECIRETLAETEAWTLDAERFGDLLGLAEMTKAAAIIQIKAMLERAEAAAAVEIEAARQRAIEAAPAVTEVNAAATTEGKADNPGLLDAAPEAAPIQRSEMAVSQIAGQHSQESACSTQAGRQRDDAHGGAETRGASPAEDCEDLSGVATGPLHQPTGLADEACRPETAKETTHRGAEQPTAAANAVGAGEDAKHAGDLQGPEDWDPIPVGDTQVIVDEAAAADIQARVILALDPEDEDDEGGIDMQLARDALDFVRGFLSVFDSKFPTQPKPGPDWWRSRRMEAEALQSQLAAAIGEGA